MPVVSVQPDGNTFTLAAGQVQGQLQVINTGQPNPSGDDTEYDAQVGDTPITNNTIAPLSADTYTVNGLRFRIDNNGPSILQLSY
jgi:hypothetical protein